LSSNNRIKFVLVFRVFGTGKDNDEKQEEKAKLKRLTYTSYGSIFSTFPTHKSDVFQELVFFWGRDVQFYFDGIFPILYTSTNISVNSLAEFLSHERFSCPIFRLQSLPSWW
jgi:hypothetical protein